MPALNLDTTDKTSMAANLEVRVPFLNHELVSLKVKPDAIKDGDVEMLQDLIMAAVNEANRKVDEAMKGKLGGMLPPGLSGLL